MSQEKKYISYAESGVNIDANDQMVDRISSSVKSTFGPRVMDLKNGFAGLFSLDSDSKLFKKNYDHPVLVACTDGVGTKILIAQQMKKFDTVGIDLVAMSVNDMLVQGADPLFFLDYLAVNKLDPENVAVMVESIAEGCRQANCSLIGGETAEMPDIYGQDEFDMAGFAVGVVEKDRIITGEKVRQGDIIIGLGSNGVHSNGFSLARTICFKQQKLNVTDKIDSLNGRAIGDALLDPTKIYVRPVVKLLEDFADTRPVHGMAHITGGGLVGNIPRVLPSDCDASIDKNAWQVPPIFDYLAQAGPVEESEMFRVFNMGIGFTLIVDPAHADAVMQNLSESGENVYRIGEIVGGSGKVILK
ncbi:Phosphoribosylformylglycinamidine cyclo-ligase [Anaerohalosphaera lusitana]|uniref:Phosphoribosylformylglycinamidine cyclo-ligase n=1 Tax=Anaerohalosphaera lusitana TaxID=1936003 RepID=A0A1U9NKY3_9BACT|nr:phosphoribosylformylglycinamidine cyclo-ligase [Anaerohalosphaera lusitana]AQT68569.1 Phosphoribosylformylglycinamidine cyclo-ligase [Anaerohalosphaera lusitana]